MSVRRTVIRSGLFPFVALAAIVAATIAACTLNPQPLPPSDFASGAEDSDASADGGRPGPENPPPQTSDAAGGNADADGAIDGGPDADAGDAATDAPDSG